MCDTQDPLLSSNPRTSDTTARHRGAGKQPGPQHAPDAGAQRLSLLGDRAAPCGLHTASLGTSGLHRSSPQGGGAQVLAPWCPLPLPQPLTDDWVLAAGARLLQPAVSLPPSKPSHPEEVQGREGWPARLGTAAAPDTWFPGVTSTMLDPSSGRGQVNHPRLFPRATAGQGSYHLAGHRPPLVATYAHGARMLGGAGS